MCLIIAISVQGRVQLPHHLCVKGPPISTNALPSPLASASDIRGFAGHSRRSMMQCLLGNPSVAATAPSLRNRYAARHMRHVEKAAVFRHGYAQRLSLCFLPPSMFSRISVVRRYLFAVSDSKTFRLLFRYLHRIVPPSSLLSLALLFVLYTIAEYTFTNWYFALGYVWKPAFPLSWRILFLSLFVVPTFSFLHLWLTLHRFTSAGNRLRRRCSSPSRPSQEYTMLPRSEANSLEERGVSSPRDDEGCDLRDIEGDAGSPRPSSPFRPRYPYSLDWTLRFIFWFAILCTSLWFALPYQQPGDLRYLPLIEKANAHPKRAGYGNQGRYYHLMYRSQTFSLTGL